MQEEVVLQSQTQRDTHSAKQGWRKVKKLVLNSRGQRTYKRVWVQGETAAQREKRIIARKKSETKRKAEAKSRRQAGGMVAVYKSDQPRLDSVAGGSRGRWDRLTLAEQQRIAGSWHIPLCEGPNHRYNY